MKSKIGLPILVAVAIGLVAYTTLVAVVFKGDLSLFLRIISRASPRAVVTGYALALVVPVIHGSTWYLLLRVFREVSKLKVLAAVFVAIFSEYIAPIGGITEFVKIFIAVKLLNFRLEEAIASVLMHRLVLSASICAVTLASLVAINSSPILYASLLLPSLGLLALNVGILVLPSSKWFEGFLTNISRRFKVDVSVVSAEYRKAVTKFRNSLPYLIGAVLLTVTERFVNGLYGMVVGSMLGLNITLPQSILAFDSLRAIVWLLPLITPGSLGVYEFIQTTLLSLIGIPLQEAGTASIVNRALVLASNYPLFLTSTAYLGVKATQLVKEYRGGS